MPTDKPIILPVQTSGVPRASADLDQVSGSVAKVGKSYAETGAVAAAALAGIAAGIRGVIDEQVAMIDTMNTAAKATGLQIETINGLRLAAKATGKELKDIVPKDLAKKMLEAQQGSTLAIRAFDDLGITLKDLDGITQDELFRRVIDGLAGIKDEGRAAGIAAQLLGKQGRELRSAFGDSSELERFVELGREFGISVGPDAAKAASAWQEANARLDLSIENVGTAFQGLTSSAATAINGLATGVVFSTELIVAQVNLIGEQFERLKAGDLQGIWEAGGWHTAGGLIPSIQEAYEKARKFATTSQEAQKELADLGEEGEEAGDKIKTRFTSSIEESIPSIAKLRQEIAALRNDEIGQIEYGVDVAIEAIDAQIEALKKIEGAEEAVLLLQEKRLAVQEEAGVRLTALTAQAEEDAATNFEALSMRHDKSLKLTKDELEAKRRASAAQASYAAQVTSSIASDAADLTSFIIGEFNTQSEEGKRAALNVWKVNKAIRVGQVVSDGIAAVMRQYADLPIYAAIPASIVTGGVAIAQAAKIASESPPAFHLGTRTADRAAGEVTTIVRRDEAVVTPQGMDAHARIADSNAGIPSSPRSYTLMIGHRAIGEAQVEQLADSRSPARRFARRQRTRPPGRRP